MSDQSTPTDLHGFRLTLGERTFVWRMGDTTARHTRALRLATSLPGQPSAAWTEAGLLVDIMSHSGEVATDDGPPLTVYAASMEAMACLAFLAELQAGAEPSWDALLDDVCGNLDASLEKLSDAEVAAGDPPA